MLRLWVKDNSNSCVHEYGTSRHDSLVLQEDGSLHYENLQCCTGTKYPEEGYSFCREDGTIPDITAVDIGEEYLDIGGCIAEQACNANVEELLLKLNLECYDNYMHLPYKEREETEYDEYHANFLASRGVVVQATAHWTLKDDNGNGICSNCNRQDMIDPLATHCRYCGAQLVPFD